MKQLLILAGMLTTFAAQSQSLKDALFSGKLKTDSGTVIRKGDDLTTKIDTAKKVTPAAVKTKETFTTPVASAGNTAAVQTSSPAKQVTEATPAAVEDETATTTTENSAPAARDNNALWKEYMNGLIGTLKEDVLTSKKIKKGDYYVSVFYAIGTDGDVEVTELLISPENKELQEQIAKRIKMDSPKLTPVVNSSGTARKVTRKYNFTLIKE